MTYQRDIRPMAERIQDPGVRTWVQDRELSDAAADRIRRVLIRWRRKQRAEDRGAS